MKKGKYSVSSFGKLKGKRRMVAALALALILVCTVGGTLAYVFTRSNSVENTFTPSHVATKVVETFDKTTKSDVKIQNVGNTDAYIRAAIVVTWKNPTTGAVYAQKPGYSISSNAKWSLGTDGYYYYNAAVKPGATTENLIDGAFALNDGVTAPEGYKLSVEIVASGIQSTGMGATSAQDAWANAKPANQQGG